MFALTLHTPSHTLITFHLETTTTSYPVLAVLTDRSSKICHTFSYMFLTACSNLQRTTQQAQQRTCSFSVQQVVQQVVGRAQNSTTAVKSALTVSPGLPNEGRVPQPSTSQKSFTTLISAPCSLSGVQALQYIGRSPL
jgi:hypothetical protein